VPIGGFTGQEEVADGPSPQSTPQERLSLSASFALKLKFVDWPTGILFGVGTIQLPVHDF